MEFHQTFTIGKRESTRFYLYQLLRARLVGSLGFGLVGALVCYLYASPYLSPAALAAAMVFTFLLMLAAIFLGYRLAVLGKLKKAAAKNGFSSYDQEILINGFGVRVKAVGRESRVGFDKLYAVRETDKDFYLYLSEQDAWILPKGQMAGGAADCAGLRKLFAKVIPSNRLHLKGGAH